MEYKELKSKYSMDETCLRLCIDIANYRSKDPNTKVGALVYDPVTGSMHMGYNGFPAGFPDLEYTWNIRENDPNNKKAYVESKYRFVVHAEANAIRKAMMAIGDRVARCTLYCTHYPCHRCAKDFIIPSGIKKVIYNDAYPPDELTDLMFDSGGIKAFLM